MAVDFTTLQTNLTAWVESISTLEVEWGRQPQKIHDGPFILAYAGPISSVGHDYPLYSYDLQTDQQSEVMYGLRRFPLRLSFRSFDQRLGLSARQFAEEFRLLLQGTNSKEFLATNCIGLIGTSALVETDYEWSGRMVSQVDLTVDLSLQLDSTNTAYSGDYISDVEITEENYIFTNDGDFVIAENGDYLVSVGRTFTVSTP